MFLSLEDMSKFAFLLCKVHVDKSCSEEEIAREGSSISNFG